MLLSARYGRLIKVAVRPTEVIKHFPVRGFQRAQATIVRHLDRRTTCERHAKNLLTALPGALEIDPTAIMREAGHIIAWAVRKPPWSPAVGIDHPNAPRCS